MDFGYFYMSEINILFIHFVLKMESASYFYDLIMGGMTCFICLTQEKTRGFYRKTEYCTHLVSE
ncbi:hypothetical protein BSQ33_19990 [Vibrio gazogenes]|uniref:Uncharacterized protein n=1 Tax=Vibrio gazogenes TaxID=687 RepID=A0A1Z2SLB1_VIBGA|nr:hypothetical protein BSQ33_19990 [Vibrio gazogenes]